jgi:hypothetical protein
MPDMTKRVRGYLASDGQFFETEAECRRHEHAEAIIGLCDSHGINAENFFVILREWNEQIRNWYDADSKCKHKEGTSTGNLTFEDVPSDQEDNEDAARRNKDAPGFLEQQIGRDK